MDTTHYAQGTLIWIKHEEEVWLQAEIVTSNDKEIIVKTIEDPDARVVLGPNEPIFLRTSDVFTSEGLSVLDDLTQLTHLHEPAVLSSLQNRFDIDKIYTFTGPILIALNPFKLIPGLYDEEVLKSFITTKQNAVANSKPHVFNTSNAAYRGICDRQKSQTVLISGESGAGKTETTKHVMKFLALAGSEDGAVTNVEKQVLESNPLLEAFGNARTLRNDNSSRFGKFIELQFRSGQKAFEGMAGQNSRLCGARIRTYLLEKVRVCDQQEGERNYHIFYEACAAAATLSGTSVYNFPQVLKKEKVKAERTIDLDGFSDLSNFAYMTRSTCRTLKDVNDVEMFERRINAMQTIGIDAEDISQIFKVIAAVLHLGNTKFDAPPNNSEGSMVMQECANSIELAAKLTGVDRKDLEGALCNQTRVTRTERIRSPVNVRTAADNRDALAKALYGMIFDLIVMNTNHSIGFIEEVKLFVGVLDIFGFECFKMNSFEQLCINFTNERLQQFFNSFVFKLEEQLYEREGIPWDPLDFPDNQDAVDILQAKGTGIFAILDEECVVPQGSDQGFCNKLMKQHKGHRRFDEIKTKPTWFIVKHFAGPVGYCTDGFLDKNKDQLSNDIIECMGASKTEFVSNLFKKDKKYAEVLNKDAVAQETKGPGGKKKKYTVSSEFKDQLTSLMDIVDLTEPHFIRCIKPNPQNEPDRYDRKGVTEQLRYGGVLQVVQVSRAGYPVRINHQECWDDYKVLCSAQVVSGLKHVDDLKLRAQKLLDHLTEELSIPKPMHGLSWAVGKTMVFFKLPAYERLKRRKVGAPHQEHHVDPGVLAPTDEDEDVQGDQVVHEAHRGDPPSEAGPLGFAEEEAACRSNEDPGPHQAVLAQRKYRAIYKKIVQIQAWRKGITGRRHAKEYRRYVSARKIQRNWRRYQDQKVYTALKKALYLAQERMRLTHAKKQMQKLKKEAKEVGALMAKSQKAAEQAAELRKRNEELEAVQLQLQSENKSLHSKVKTLEETLHEMQQTLEEAKKTAEEAERLAADTSKTVVDTETLSAMQNQVEERDAEFTKLQEELAGIKTESQQQQQKLQDAEGRYQQLLKSTATQSTAGLTMGAGGAAGASKMASLMAKGASSKSNRNVNIQLCGAQSVGKTALLEALIKEQDPAQMAKFSEQRANLMSHHQIQVGDKLMKLLDCSGNSRAQHLVKEWFGRSHWVFVVYDMSKQESLEYALELAKEVHAAGAKMVLFGNRYNVDQGEPVEVDIMAAKDAAVRNDGNAIESSSLMDAVKLVSSAMDEPEVSEPAAGMDAMSPDGNRRSSISAAIDSVKSWFGGAERGRANQGVLRPSLKGTKTMKVARREGDVNADLRPVQELQDSESAVTCICFGQEKYKRNYILLATASKDGTVVIYRAYRTEMEMACVNETEFPLDKEEGSNAAFAQPPQDNSNIAVHSRLVGHSRAITSIFFTLLEDQVVTTSIDKSVRFWGIDSGEMLKVFTDSSPVPVATFLPFNPQVFVAANSNAVLRLVNVQNGMVLQKLKVETEVRALKFDDTGLFLLAGTKSGSIHVLEASDSSTLKFKFKVQLARGGVTCITFVSAAYGQPPCLLVNTSDSSATIIDCTYGPQRGPQEGNLQNLAVRSRVRVAHSLLPLKCCYSPSGQGYLISGSEDKEVYIYSLAKGSNYKMQYLKHHQVPVVAVAVNLQDTLLASADSLGRIVLWRRMDFSHITD
eukprot:CAMPEP_0115487064 /NCGR_PEP_ID=MMETSP0271-20121206/60759_1 /TAXON_ID=71861 /ORGANISM="Scrippsiella trochoidea, Strain CCMP3099" /LENGTH=1711 /DNA_ID=CAMNT_0002915095 /DNA_START=96 /DNA_END=5231 /DNA_ORIENTATION=+